MPEQLALQFAVTVVLPEQIEGELTEIAGAGLMVTTLTAALEQPLVVPVTV
jgi:hypothetical protein